MVANKSRIFQEVYNLVSKIPKGKVTTYKILAQRLNIKNPQLVGKILNQNPYLIKIPCHRVIKSNGQIGGYKLGMIKKINLLKDEGVIIKNRKVTNFQNILEKFE